MIRATGTPPTPVAFPALRQAPETATTEPDYLAGPPLVWRLLAANLVVVLGGAVVGTALTQRFVLSGSFTPLTHVGMILVAIGLSAALTAAVLRIAFRPLRALREEIEQAGRATQPIAAFNTVLDRYGDPDILAVAQAVRRLWGRLDQHVKLLEESNRRLEEQRRELADKTLQMERLATMALAAQEEERRRIARELHDETMQSMAALIMGLERGLQAMPEDIPHLRAAHLSTARLRDLAIRTLDELRHLALDLRPAVLDDHGLGAAVRWLADEQTARFGLPTAVELSGDFAAGDTGPAHVSTTVETTVFRITQEALANVAKHAHAQRVVVRLGRAHGVITLEVEDDGVGIPPGNVARPGHMGLFNMKERATLLGGTCTVSRRPSGTGTLVRAQVPLAAPPAGRWAAGAPREDRP